MAGKNKNLIAQEIKAHIDKSGQPYSNWYVGITSDIDQRLHGDHRVPKENHWFIWREALTADDAREIESYFHRLGCKGDSGGGDESSVFVYAYLITSVTRE